MQFASFADFLKKLGGVKEQHVLKAVQQKYAAAANGVDIVGGANKGCCNPGRDFQATSKLLGYSDKEVQEA